MIGGSGGWGGWEKSLVFGENFRILIPGTSCAHTHPSIILYRHFSALNQASPPPFPHSPPRPRHTSRHKYDRLKCYPLTLPSSPHPQKIFIPPLRVAAPASELSMEKLSPTGVSIEFPGWDEHGFSVVSRREEIRDRIGGFFGIVLQFFFCFWCDGYADQFSCLWRKVEKGGF